MLGEILLALILALLFGGLLFSQPGRKNLNYKGGPAAGFLAIFIITFFAIWAGGIWLTPFGPTYYDISWAPFLVTAIIVVLIIAAFTSPQEQNIPPKDKQPEKLRDLQEEEDMVEASIAMFGFFFWILLLFLIAAIITRYAYFIA